MITQSRPQQSQQPWYGMFAQAAPEFSTTQLPILSGAIPENLKGSLYRNGPGRLERGGQRVGHWFDGDGAVLAVHFDSDQASGVYRYVQTAGYQAEEQADQFLMGGYGMLPAGSLWRRLQQGATKNAANTSVLALPDKLLTLWEGGHPHALDLASLETQGLDDLGFLAPDQSFSAHPKCDPHSGEIYNFGVSYGKQGQLHIYRCSAEGKVKRQTKIPLKGLPMIHDFVMAGPYLIFCIPPVSMNPLPLLAQMKSYSDCLQWKPHQGTQILVIDRESLEVVSQGEADPWYQWHFGNGYIDDQGHVIIDFVRYADFSTNQFLKEVISGHPQTQADGQLWRLHLDPRTGKVLETYALIDRTGEFPIVDPHQVGLAHSHTYLSTRPASDPTTELFREIVCFDHASHRLSSIQVGEQAYCSEPIYAPEPGQPRQGWIISVVYQAASHTSEVWILAADHLEDGPICRLGLPSVVPMGFHGTWQPSP
ncbi:carotenoid oxygenase family protein [Acaryochloris sp. 'Moss Beach']|uniref:carotenoid oxygenase family protein n=1 Tax=Acaryochloris sp. 'Moss Beach' TaxID=2740837 RepID=UPI001F25AF00|nr:carotenoid oxygenase family protein [Acaryochloris sp. 'Moss Beach']UJB70434.1 carotenoid oxygenase family protein [Acaryochloris sp. 'Moss Beach']